MFACKEWLPSSPHFEFFCPCNIASLMCEDPVKSGPVLFTFRDRRKKKRLNFEMKPHKVTLVDPSTQHHLYLLVINILLVSLFPF